LAQEQPRLPRGILDLFSRHEKKQTRPSTSEILTVLQSVVAGLSRAFVIVDALDECQSAERCRTKFLDEIISLQTKKTNKANISATWRPNLDT
jgi:hypothetical protein